ncbi:GtrA family protein [bacterium]|nr:MAG: GtrA family protein [bacterium]
MTTRNFVAAAIARRGVRQFVKFGIVGASGFVVNLIAFTVLDKATHWPFIWDFSIAFMLGGVSNYALNRVWTFRSSGHPGREGMQFLTVSFLALLLGDLVSWFLKGPLHVAGNHRVWFAATVSGMFLNFFVNKYWTFKDRA